MLSLAAAGEELQRFKDQWSPSVWTENPASAVCGNTAYLVLGFIEAILLMAEPTNVFGNIFLG